MKQFIQQQKKSVNKNIVCMEVVFTKKKWYISIHCTALQAFTEIVNIFFLVNLLVRKLFNAVVINKKKIHTIDNKKTKKKISLEVCFSRFVYTWRNFIFHSKIPRLIQLEIKFSDKTFS